jgi:hypothetical protein
MLKCAGGLSALALLPLILEGSAQQASDLLLRRTGVVGAASAASKIAIDLSNVNAEGLRGSGTGLRAVHYEYCIPTGQRHEAEVRSIDATAQFMRGSRGRIGCSSAQVLVLGNTHQPEYRQVLDRLAALPYVNRIMESFFE